MLEDIRIGWEALHAQDDANAKHNPTRDTPGYMSADERRATGKALRDRTPRAAHGGWKPPRDRRDPIELLRESNEGRIPELIPIRFGRMSQSPFAFYRGRPRSWRRIWRRPRPPDFASRPVAMLT